MLFDVVKDQKREIIEHRAKSTDKKGGVHKQIWPQQTQIHTKMLDSIKAMQKRSDLSEYAALNFTQIGDYKLGKQIGAGAFASVNQAIHSATGFQVAIKIYNK